MSKSFLFVFRLLALLVFAVVFYHFYGALNFPGFNADQAMHVIMAEQFSLPEDLYFAGQTRLGSLIPALTALVEGIFPEDLLLLTSLVQTFLLAITVWLIQLHTRHWYAAVLVMITLLFPAMPFENLVKIGHPEIAHLFFLSILIFLVFRKRKEMKPGWYYAFLPLLACLGLWSSELFVTNILALIIVGGPHFREAGRQIKKHWYAWLLSTLAGVSFLWMAKHYAHPSGYESALFGSVSEMWEGLGIYWDTVHKNLTFDSPNPVGHIAFMVALIALALFFYYLLRSATSTLTKFLLLSAVFHAGAVFLSGWSAQNGYPLRYHCAAVAQLVWAMVFFYDEQPRKIPGKITTALMVLLMAATGLYWVQRGSYHIHERMGVKTARALAQNDNIAVLGSYWNSHLVEAYNASGIVSSPASLSSMRYFKNMNTLFYQDSVLVVKNGFTKVLPDTLRIFGGTMWRSSQLRKQGNMEYAFYQILKPVQSYYSARELKSGLAEKYFRGDTLVIAAEDSLAKGAVIFGPYCNLPEGNYKICFKFNELQIESKSSLSLEVTERISTRKLDRRTLAPGAHNTCFEIEARNPLALMEFRIWRSIGAGFKFEGVSIESIKK